MKAIKLILISALFIPLLTNCGVTKKDKAIPATTTTVTTTTFCAANPNDSACNPTTQNGLLKVMTGNFNVTDKDEYETMLKGVFGFCDTTYITNTGELFSTILGSALTSAANRCSKWNSRGTLEMVFTGDGRVNLRATAISNYGQYVRNNSRQLFYIPYTEFIAANYDQDSYIDLDRYSNGVNTGLVLYIEGDINSDRFEVIFRHHGDEMATIRMYKNLTY